MRGAHAVPRSGPAGTKHRGGGAGGHGHPRFLWHTRFEPALPAGITTLTLSATAFMDAAAITALIRLPHWPPSGHEAVARVATRPTRGRPRFDQVGSALPDRVVALSADLGDPFGRAGQLTAVVAMPEDGT